MTYPILKSVVEPPMWRIEKHLNVIVGHKFEGGTLKAELCDTDYEVIW